MVPNRDVCDLISVFGVLNKTTEMISKFDL
jgi:hypothetical protein